MEIRIVAQVIIAPANRQKKQMRVKLSAFGSACDRHGIYDRSAAAIASAVLQDFGLIDENNQDNVVDRSKVRRERSRKREFSSRHEQRYGGTVCRWQKGQDTGK